MTVNFQKVLNKICNDEIFNDKQYFLGGTALAYYLNHRVSEDIDIVCITTLNYKAIISAMTSLEAVYLSENDRIDFRFEEIKEQVITRLLSSKV